MNWLFMSALLLDGAVRACIALVRLRMSKVLNVLATLFRRGCYWNSVLNARRQRHGIRDAYAYGLIYECMHVAACTSWSSHDLSLQLRK